MLIDWQLSGGSQSGVQVVPMVRTVLCSALFLTSFTAPFTPFKFTHMNTQTTESKFLLSVFQLVEVQRHVYICSKDQLWLQLL